MLDEPASGLSRGERERLIELLARACALTTTLLLIEHDMDVALRIAERVVVMSDGVVVAARQPRRDPPATRWCTRSTSGPQAAMPDRRRRRNHRALGDRCWRSMDLCAGYGASQVLEHVSFSMGRRGGRASSAATAWARRRCATPSWA